MNTNHLTRGAAIVAAAAALFAQGCSSMDDDTASNENALKCLGANECKGMSECAGGTGASSCKGMNECKGMGWIYTATEAECTEKGGKVQT